MNRFMTILYYTMCCEGHLNHSKLQLSMDSYGHSASKSWEPVNTLEKNVTHSTGYCNHRFSH